MNAFRAGVIFFVVGPPLAGFLSIAAIELINFTGTSFGQAIGSSAILVIAGFWLVYLIGGLPALITGLTVAWLHPLTTYPVTLCLSGYLSAFSGASCCRPAIPTWKDCLRCW